MGTPKENLRIDETAEFLNCSKRTVYRLIEEGSLHCFKIRNSLRIPADEVKKYIKQ